MTYFNLPHPECEDEEVFVANADDSTYSKIWWKTKRKGMVAYMRSGEEVGIKWRGSFPVFAKKSEIRDKDPEILKRLEEGE